MCFYSDHSVSLQHLMCSCAQDHVMETKISFFVVTCDEICWHFHTHTTVKSHGLHIYSLIIVHSGVIVVSYLRQGTLITFVGQQR